MKFFFLLLLLISKGAFAQEDKGYVIVPHQYYFAEIKNEYNLNMLTQFFFKSEGYKVLYNDDQLPKELAQDRCKAFYVEVTKKQKIFTTQMTVQLKDCYNEIVAVSEVGTSRIKEPKGSQTEALRNALVSFKGKEFSLKTSNKTNSTIAVTEKPQTIVKDIVVVEKETTYQVKSKLSNKYKVVKKDKGFSVMDASGSKTLFSLKETSLPNVFIANKTGIKGVLLQKNKEWFFEYYFEEDLISEKVEVTIP